MSYQIIKITNKSTGAVASKYRGFFGGKHDTEEEANDILQSLTSLSEDNKWITRIKTDTKGVIQ